MYSHNHTGCPHTVYSLSSKQSGIPPEVTPRSRDVNAYGGGVNDLNPLIPGSESYVNKHGGEVNALLTLSLPTP
jgi:hypothetical protein